MPEGPVFRAPWEAQIFALVTALREKGVFTAGEWAQALGATIRNAQAAGDPDTGETAYRHWLPALESLLEAKGLGSRVLFEAREAAWERAEKLTPHGRAVELAKGLVVGE